MLDQYILVWRTFPDTLVSNLGALYSDIFFENLYNVDKIQYNLFEIHFFMKHPFLYEFRTILALAIFVGILGLVALAFFHSIKLNEELGEEYYELEGIFSYLNLDHTDEGGLIDTEKEYKLKDIKNKEFFTGSENVLKKVNKIKHVSLRSIVTKFKF